MKKRRIAVLLAAVMAVTMVAGCGNGNVGNSEADNENEQITLKVFSNLPDRKNGQGLVEQMLIDEYMEENENVVIEVEALDEEAYKTKFKAYAMEGMPDVVNIWGQPAFLDEVLAAGILAELNEDDYKDSKFIEGSLDGFKKDGKLYGLPRNTDVDCFYYNQKMFKDNGWEVPATYDELLVLGAEIRKAGLVPLAMDGGDGWPLSIYYSDILFKITDDYRGVVRNAIENADFSDPAFIQATELLRKSAETGLFQEGFDSQDYGTAMNLFTNGQAAMFYMGSWEASMAVNEDIPEEIRTNIRAFTMPVVEGGKAIATDIATATGAGYAVCENSKVKDEAVKFVNFMYQPDKLSKYGWENSVGMSAQDQTEFMTGDETELQLQFLEIIKDATNVSGIAINDCGTSAFKTCVESEIQSVANGSISAEEFLSRLENACK